MMAELKHKGLVGLIRISESGECKIEILPMQEEELPLEDGEEIAVVAE